MDGKRIAVVDGPSMPDKVRNLGRLLVENFKEAKAEIEDKPRSRARRLKPFVELIKPGQTFDGPAHPTQVIVGHDYRYWTDGSVRRDLPKANKAARKALKRLARKEQEARRAAKDR